MKTQEELNALKEEVEALNKKLAELTDEELEKMSGGNEEATTYTCGTCGKQFTSLDAYARHSRIHYQGFP